MKAILKILLIIALSVPRSNAPYLWAQPRPGGMAAASPVCATQSGNRAALAIESILFDGMARLSGATFKVKTVIRSSGPVISAKDGIQPLSMKAHSSICGGMPGLSRIEIRFDHTMPVQGDSERDGTIEWLRELQENFPTWKEASESGIDPVRVSKSVEKNSRELAALTIESRQSPGGPARPLLHEPGKGTEIKETPYFLKVSVIYACGPDFATRARLFADMTICPKVPGLEAGVAILDTLESFARAFVELSKKSALQAGLLKTVSKESPTYFSIPEAPPADNR